MIFIYENQFSVTALTNTRDLKAFIYKEACTIYKSLYHLSDEVLKDVKKIFFLIEGNGFDEKSAMNNLKHFSADIEDYPAEIDLMNEIWNWFPINNELIDRDKRKTIETLIRELSISFFEIGKKTKKKFESQVMDTATYLFICSLIKNNSLSLLKTLEDDQVLIQGDNRIAKLRAGNNHYSISRKKFLQLTEVLNNVIEQNKKLQPEKQWKIRDYKPGDPLNYFSNSFMDKIVFLRTELKKSIQFYGQDTLLTNRAIEMLLRGEDRIYYSMPNELRTMQAEKKSTIIWNFDSINDPNAYHELHERVKGIENIFYVILQAIRNVNSKYFSYYENIEVPNTKEIRKHITGIFLSLLIDRNQYRDDYWKLYLLVEKNLLEKVIPQIDNLEILYKCIQDFSELNMDDLLTNIDFWYSLEERVNSEIEALKQAEKTQLQQNILFNRVDDLWFIEGLGKISPLMDGKNIGLLYLLIIIESKRNISSTEIMDISVKYRNTDAVRKERASTKKSKDPENLLESDRKTISGAFTRLKKYKNLHKFIKDHISPSKGYYFFDHRGQYDVKIDPPDLIKKHF